MSARLAWLVLGGSLWWSGCYASHEVESGERSVLCPYSEEFLDAPMFSVDSWVYELEGPAAFCREATLDIGPTLTLRVVERSPGGRLQCALSEVDGMVRVRVGGGGPLAIVPLRQVPCFSGSLPDPLRIRNGGVERVLELGDSDAVCVAGQPDEAPRDGSASVQAICRVFRTVDPDPTPRLRAFSYELEVVLAPDATLGLTGCVTRVDRRSNRIVIEPRHGGVGDRRPGVDGIRCVIPMIPECELPWTLVVGDREVAFDRVLAVDSCLTLD